MRTLLAAALAALLAAGTAWAGVVPNHGNQNMSGAKIKPPSHEQDKQEGDPSAEKQEAPKDDKR
jgi:hypothetical protein